MGAIIINNLGTKTIETERLILRKFKLDDAEAMYSNWANDEDVTKFLTWPTHTNVDVSRKILKDWVGQYDKEDYYQWAIVLKEYSTQPIGSIGVANQNELIESIEIGYCIGKKWWNKGITSEALNALIEYFIKEVKVNRIQARYDINNVGSGKVMERCGMKYEGVLRRSDRNNLGICDMAVYSLLYEEYSN